MTQWIRNQGCKCLPALLLLIVLSEAQAAPLPPEQLLPAGTAGLVANSNPRKLEDSWRETQLFKLMDEPQFKPIVDDVMPKTKGGNYLLDTIGVNWDTVRNAASGELGWGMVLANPTEAAHVLTLDMTDRGPQARTFFLEIGDKLQNQGAKFSNRTLDGFNMVVAAMPDGKQIIYGIKDGIMICTDHFGVLRGILARMNGTANDSLASQQPFQMVQ